MIYKEKIDKLVRNLPLEIDADIKISGKVPTSVSSEFITNKEQGDWAESIVFEAINSNYSDYIAVKYGRNDNISAGDKNFAEFYSKYQEELNTIGKKPDILIFNKKDYHGQLSDDIIKKSVCALEVRSSSFLVNKYNSFILNRESEALKRCKIYKNKIFNNPKISSLLLMKNKILYDFLKSATDEMFYELDFRKPTWSSSKELQDLVFYLNEIKEGIKILRKRDYLSITPKVEDIALVNRWIQIFGVPHYYLQVFFDKAYVISFEDILQIISDVNKEGKDFTIERDVKNQGKTTIKINVNVADIVFDKIQMPNHVSVMKELDRGRLLFYVHFEGGKGYLLRDNFFESILKNGY